MKNFVTQTLPDHPCMNDRAHRHVARIHLPVAGHCTVSCGYCERNVGGPEAGRVPVDKPGSCRKIMEPVDAVGEAEAFLDEWGRNAIIGIAGPGDPLASPATHETLSRLRTGIPDARLCLCTNGLHLPESLDLLKAVDLNFLSVTVNAVSVRIIETIYSRIGTGRNGLSDADAAAILGRNQLEGIERAAALGIFVKVNMVVIPGINDDHVTDVAGTVSGLGAKVLNLMPLIPGGRFKNIKAPSRAMMDGLFAQCEPHISVFRSCRQCRADARGIPGKDGCEWKKTA